MRSLKIVSLIVALSFCSVAQAASTDFAGYRFHADVVSSGRLEQVSNRYGIVPGNYLYVQEGQEYSIRVYNPLPVRVGVAVTVDGLNTINGKNTSPAQSAKWIIQPHSSITIDGWQTGSSNLRKFVFERPEKSYATWRERTEGVAHTLNHGVIGIAYFWDSYELASVLRQNRHYDKGYTLNDSLAESDVAGLGRKSSRMRPEMGSTAGTGMGRTEYNPVYNVAFNFNSGMYSISSILKIHYRFGPAPRPHYSNYTQPYRYNHRGYTPEMPNW